MLDIPMFTSKISNQLMNPTIDLLLITIYDSLFSVDENSSIYNSSVINPS